MYSSVIFDIRLIKSNLCSLTTAILPLYGEQTQQDVLFSSQFIENGLLDAISEFLYLSLIGYNPIHQYCGSDVDRVEYALHETIGLSRVYIPDEFMVFLVDEFIAIRNKLQAFLIHVINAVNVHSTLDDITIKPTTTLNVYFIIMEFCDYSTIIEETPMYPIGGYRPCITY